VQGANGWDILAALEDVKAGARVAQDGPSEAAAIAVEKRVRYVRAQRLHDALLSRAFLQSSACNLLLCVQLHTFAATVGFQDSHSLQCHASQVHMR
jgi:hypothetical protein